jgi:glutathione S-transferase
LHKVIQEMKLIGQFDSPFVRRVGITLSLYQLPFDHLPWSVFGDAEKLATVNPLMRVPTLVLENGDVLVETASIIDYLDGLAPPDKRLTPQSEPNRRQILRSVGLASGVSDKAVSLFYEQRLHETPSPTYVARLSKQIVQTLALLEKEAPKDGYWFGALTQADLCSACMWRHLSACHPLLANTRLYPSLSAHAARMEALSVFETISQPFIAPT